MKVVILCGGQGTRIRDVSENQMPKPMVPIGNRPILWHIMKLYATHGYQDFVLCLGHLGWSIKEFFLNYDSMINDFTIELGRDARDAIEMPHSESGWRITLADTGEATETGGRVKKASKYLDGDEFHLTYGDGVSDINIAELVKFHRSHGKLATITGVRPSGRFGELGLDGGRIVSFKEKPIGTGGFINGGFMVLQREFIERYLRGDEATLNLEREPFQKAAAEGQMMMYAHDGFWQCMDTYRDWKLLNDLWKGGNAPWKQW
jgi:glucose-1-phosphate cytidylyltransferase